MAAGRAGLPAATLARLDWPAIVARARTIVDGYDTGVTLRQLFYRLVSEQSLPNTTNAYKALSDRTAKARRNDAFPDLIDRNRTIHRYQTFADTSAALRWLTAIYRRDRTAGQPVSLYIGVEKNGIVEQLQDWFGDLGVPILAFGGYSSQSYVDQIQVDVAEQDRPAVLLYGGDFDPSGEDIERDFDARTQCFQQIVRVALTAEQVRTYALPPNPGKVTDSRAAGFIARHGELVQVELDALDPNDLRALYQDAIDEFWDGSAHDAAMVREQQERRRLAEVLR